MSGRSMLGRTAKLLCAVAGVAGLAVFAGASPSGLNNTPTADTCSERTAVLQAWEGFGHDMKPDNWVGVKYGSFNSPTFGSVEIGSDWRMNGDPNGTATFQGKYAVGLGDTGLRLCAGIANLSADKDRNGESMPYGVMTYDLKGWFRAHAGYGFQKDNEGAFGGLDKTLELLDRDVTFWL